MPILRQSKKRDAILRRMKDTDCHPTAEWIFKQLRTEFPDLSLGTVYRNLNQLCEEGLIWKIGAVCGQERYDACTAPHAHFICDKCGEVTDLPDQGPGEEYLRSLSHQHQFMVSGYELKLRGICKHCQS